MRNRSRRLTRRSAVVVLVALVSMLATTLPAFAHHPEVDANAVCAVDGRIRVDFTARTWSATGSGGLHDDVRVGQSWSSPGSGTSASAPYTTHVQTGAFTDGNGRQFSGHFFLPATDGGSTVYVTSWAVGTWGNGNGGYQYRTAGVTLPTDCGPDEVEPTPAGSLTPACGSWSAAVSVAALGQNQVAVPPTVVFQVWDGAVLLDSVELAPGEADTLGGSFGEDTGVHDVTLVAVGVGQLDAASVETDCEPNPVEPVPAGDLDSSCGEWSASVSVAALGDHEVAVPPTVVFQVWDGAVLLDSVELAPGEADTLGGSFGEDTGVHDVTLVAVGLGQLDAASVETDCESSPAVELGDECAEGGIAVLLSNPDAPTAEFQVWSGDTLIETVELATTTEPYTVLVPAGEGETVDITVWVDGGEVPFATYEVTRDCEPPGVVVETCTPDGSLMVNVTELPADTFTIVVDGPSLSEPIERTSVGAVADYTEYFDLEDGTYVVTVYDSSQEVIWTDTVVIDCDAPVVVVAEECVDGDGTVTVTVTETPDGEVFTATIGDTSVDVVGGVATFEGLADGTYEVTVTSDQGYDETFEVVVDCDAPIVVVAEECDAEDGTVTVTVTETPDDETFTVTIDGVDKPVVGGVATFEGLADGTYEVTVTSDQGYDETFEVTVDCDVDTDVGGEEVEQPAPEPEPEPEPAPQPEPAPEPAPAPTPQAPALAVTGVDGLSMMALVAVVLMLLGGLALRATRAATGTPGPTDMRLGIVPTPERTNPSLSRSLFVMEPGTTATAPRRRPRWRPRRRG